MSARPLPELSKDLDLLIDEATLRARVNELGRQIKAAYEGKPLVVVGVLKGSLVFVADLIRAIDLPLTIDFLGLSSYGDNTESSGVVRITSDLSKPIEGKHVLVVEDIVDTGFTLSHVLRLLRSREPRRLMTCVLLDKPTRREVEIRADWTGFAIPDEFVVGYGIDFAQRNRNLPYIGKVRFTEG